MTFSIKKAGAKLQNKFELCKKRNYYHPLRYADNQCITNKKTHSSTFVKIFTLCVNFYTGISNIFCIFAE